MHASDIVNIEARDNGKEKINVQSWLRFYEVDYEKGCCLYSVQSLSTLLSPLDLKAIKI
jgi:hypothetical protein